LAEAIHLVVAARFEPSAMGPFYWFKSALENKPISNYDFIVGGGSL
jgi:hypothetical protein